MGIMKAPPVDGLHLAPRHFSLSYPVGIMISPESWVEGPHIQGEGFGEAFSNVEGEEGASTTACAMMALNIFLGIIMSFIASSPGPLERVRLIERQAREEGLEMQAYMRAASKGICTPTGMWRMWCGRPLQHSSVMEVFVHHMWCESWGGVLALADVLMPLCELSP
jgi:hypothetical protein